ncbi:uncharacterized protein LOC130444197 [Diorhabda sublineata]|uniref:uncharacterized protein LOC130444197 n=1 Tax=Diorhabda sublineata TaxID=1163346 RepID=UPI0024E12F44|nr:uncharacterized protein LOC130444197 [Diorhabda sublineata]
MESPVYKIICHDYPAEFLLDKTIAKEYFKQFGHIKRIVFRKKVRSCVVEYGNQEDYLKALNNAGNYKGITFNVSSLTENLSTSKTNLINKNHMWIDNEEIEAELAAMSGQASNLIQSVGGQSQNTDDTPKKLKKTWKSGTKSKKSLKPKENIDLTVSAKEVELIKVLLSQAFTNEDKYKILEARDKLMKLKLKKNPPVKTCATIGTCPDMCPEKERLFREIKHQVAWYEQDENEKCMDHSKAVKQYSRSSADQEAPLSHELRPVKVLQMTMGYLLHNIVDLCDTDEVHLGEWFHFLWDRTRGIRKDITQQELCSQGAVELVEQCARFHIHCSARLVAEDASVFDQKINTENMTKCLQTLKYMYHDLALKEETCENEAEFRAYVILLNLNDGNFMWEVQQLRREIQRSKEVQFAMKVYSALDKNNYIKFFKLLYSTSYLNACILMRYFNQVRIAAIKTLHKCCVPRGAKIAYPLNELNKSLAFDDIDSTIDFLKYCGLQINEAATSVILDKADFCLPQFSYIMDRSKVVEDKRKHSVGRIICGKKLPEKTYQMHIVENSFDLNGYIKNNDILDDIDLEKIKSELLEQLRNENEPKEKATLKSIFKIADTVPDVKEEQGINPFLNRDEKVENPFVFVKKEESVSKSFSFIKNKETPEIAFGVMKREEKNDIPFSFAKEIVKVDNPFAVSKKDIIDSPFGFVKKEEKFSNPFALGKKEISKTGSIFDTTPPSPKSIFSVPLFGKAASVRESVPSADKSDFSFVSKPIAVVEQKSKSSDLKKGGFKFDLVFPYPKKTDEISIIHHSFNEHNKRENRIELLDKKKEEEDMSVLEKERLLEMQMLKEQEKLEEQKIAEEKKKKEVENLLQEKMRKEEQLNKEKIERELKRKRQEEELRIHQQEIKKKEQIEELEIRNCVKNLLSSIVIEIDKQFREKRLREIKENRERLLLKRIFREWKIGASKNSRKRKAVDCSPIWINTKTLRQSADELHVDSQEMTLALRKRYKSGEPLNIECRLEGDIKKVNLYQLTYSILKNRIYDLTVTKPKNIFWKVVISFPDEHELTVGLNRLEETMERAFQWKKQLKRYYNVEHIKINCTESVTYCVEKRKGCRINQFDANGIVFLNKAFDANLQNRMYKNLIGYGNTKVPIVIVLREGNPSDCNLEELIEQNIVSDYLILIENSSFDCKLVEVVEEGLMFLAKNVDSSPPLELDTFKAFITKYACSEIWKRANSFSKWNTSYKKCLQKPNVVINLFNEAINKLKLLIFNPRTRYITFPNEFKKYLNNIPDFLPCSFRYFPSFWNTQSYLNSVEDLLTKLMLPNWSCEWPPLNKSDLEHSVIKYSSKVSNQPDTLFYKIMSLLLRQIDPNVNLCDIQNVLWTDIVGLIGLEKLKEIDVSLNRNSIFKEYFVIYNKNELSEYVFGDWFYISNPKIRKLVEEDLEREAVIDVKKTSDLSEQLNVGKDIDYFWNSSLTQILDNSNVIKDIDQLKRTIDDLANNMSVHKNISKKLDENLKKIISEK